MFLHPVYPPRPQLIPLVYDYEQQINGIHFHTRVHQGGHTIAHYTAFTKPGERTPSFIDTVCTIQPDHSLECRSTISMHQYRQPLNVIRIPTPYPSIFLSPAPINSANNHYRNEQSGRDCPQCQPTPIPH